jgi:hypothetical protein
MRDNIHLNAAFDELQASKMSNILWPMFLLLVLVFASGLSDAQQRKEIT